MRRLLRRFLLTALTLVAIASMATAAVVTLNCAAFGRDAKGDRLARMHASPQWHDDGFENPQPLWNNLSVGSYIKALREGSDYGSPEDPDKDISAIHGDGSVFATLPAGEVRVTWFGHSSVMIELDGSRVLTDPVWGPRTSPITWLGPKRWYAPPIALDQLPVPDAVVISHDHYDHLDYPTIKVIRDWDTTFLVPLGVGAHLEHWGVPAEHIVELDWWDRHALGDLELVCTPARHASGRGIFDQNATLWAGWALLGPRHRVFFSGDTGLFDGLREIGQKLGPFDVAMVEVGAYHQNWPDWHIGPEQAVLAHQWLRGDLFIPIHWGLFDLALHGWTEPAERVLVAAEKAGVRLYIPRPGESVVPRGDLAVHRWWPNVPWNTADQDPIVSTATNGQPARAD